MKSVAQFTIFLTGSLIYGLITFQSIMWAVWGAPTYFIQYVALFSSFGLLVSSFVSLSSAHRGRWLSLIFILGIGVYYIPATAALVPKGNFTPSPMGYALIGGYFALLAYCLFFPKRLPLSRIVFSLAVITSAGFVINTLLNQNKNENEPNKAVEPTPVAVTPGADAPVAPSTSAAHF